jgi:2-C-methyl-D-erythritol 4-phosphate cytidylyltransferase
VEVVTRAGRLAQLLDQRCDLVVLHDPTHPLIDPDTVRAVLDQWHDDGACVAAVGCTAVTDTLKHADHAGRVLTTLDREDYRALTGPLVVTHAALSATVAVSSQAGQDIARAVEILDRTVGVRRVPCEVAAAPVLG